MNKRCAKGVFVGGVVVVSLCGSGIHSADAAKPTIATKSVKTTRSRKSTTTTAGQVATSTPAVAGTLPKNGCDLLTNPEVKAFIGAELACVDVYRSFPDFDVTAGKWGASLRPPISVSVALYKEPPQLNTRDGKASFATGTKQLPVV